MVPPLSNRIVLLAKSIPVFVFPSCNIESATCILLENVEIPKITGSFNGWDLRGANKIQDQGAGGVVLPILSAGAFNDIDVTVGNQPELGTLVMTDENATTTDTPLRIWWDDGSGPGWYKITVTI